MAAEEGRTSPSASDLVLVRSEVPFSKAYERTPVPPEWVKRLVGVGLDSGAAALLGQGAYKIVASPELLSKIASGEATIMTSALGQLSGVQGAGGKIIDHVEYAKAGPTSAGADVLFGMMAIATQQYYLPEIRNSLRALEQGLRRLQEAHWRSLNGSLTAIDKEAATLFRLLIENQVAQEDRNHVMELAFRASEILEGQREWVSSFVDRLTIAAADNDVSSDEVMDLLPQEGEEFIAEASLFLRASVVRLAVLFLRAQYAADEGSERLRTHVEAYESDLQEVVESLEIFTTAVQALLVEIEEIELTSVERRITKRGLEKKLQDLASLGTSIEQVLESHLLHQLQARQGAVGFVVDLEIDVEGNVAQAALTPAREDLLGDLLAQAMESQQVEVTGDA